MTSRLQIGWSEIDITPSTDKYIALAGQYYERLSRYIHSRLKATAVAMSCGDQSFLECGIDNGGVNQPLFDRVKALVKEAAPDIDTDFIFMHAIHTHTAPSYSCVVNKSAVLKENVRENVLSNREYADFCAPLLAKALVDAWQARKPGGIARAFGNARVGHCRRAVYANGLAEMYGDTTRPDFVGMEAGEDSGVEMLFTYDEQGNRTGLLLNVACPSQCMESTYRISSDFAGATRELLKEDFGQDFHTIYQISAAGCQSPRDLVRHYTTEPDFWHADGVVELAGRLRRCVTSAVPEAVEFAPVFQSIHQVVTLPRRRASYEEYQEAKAELARLEAIMPEAEAFQDFLAETRRNEKLNGPGPYDSKLHHFVQIKNAKAVILRYEDQDELPCISFDMNVVRIGDIAIATNPFELYHEFAQRIKARAKAEQVFIIQLSNGLGGYLPTRTAVNGGSYSSKAASTTCGPDGGDELVEKTLKNINSMWK